MVNSDELEALRDAEAGCASSQEIELLRVELNRKIDEAADLVKRISLLSAISSHPRTQRAGKES